MSNRLLVKRARESLYQLQRGDITHCQKLLSGIPDIGHGMAGDILAGILEAYKTTGLASHPLLLLVSWGADALGMIQIKQKSRTIKLGKSRAEKILNMLYWRSGASTRQSDMGDKDMMQPTGLPVHPAEYPLVRTVPGARPSGQGGTPPGQDGGRGNAPSTSEIKEAESFLDDLI
jgi:hypothetical protein